MINFSVIHLINVYIYLFQNNFCYILSEIIPKSVYCRNWSQWFLNLFDLQLEFFNDIMRGDASGWFFDCEDLLQFGFFRNQLITYTCRCFLHIYNRNLLRYNRRYLRNCFPHVHTHSSLRGLKFRLWICFCVFKSSQNFIRLHQFASQKSSFSH